MTDLPAIGTVFTEPGFVGTVVGHASGWMVIDARLEGVIPQHAASSDEIAVLIEGRVRLTQDGKSSLIEAGEMVVVPAGVEHMVEALVPSRLMLMSGP